MRLDEISTGLTETERLEFYRMLSVISESLEKGAGAIVVHFLRSKTKKVYNKGTLRGVPLLLLQFTNTYTLNTVAVGL